MLGDFLYFEIHSSGEDRLQTSGKSLMPQFKHHVPRACVPRRSDAYAHVPLILRSSMRICACAALRVRVCVHCVSLRVCHFYVHASVRLDVSTVVLACL